MGKSVEYFVFDIESVADGDLVSSVRYPGESLSPQEAIARYRDELMESRGTDFIPYTFQVPISITIGKVDPDFRLLEVVVLDEDQSRPHVMTELFWRGWKAYHCPTLVTFNGRTFDLPMLELAAFRYGISVPSWFDLSRRAYEQPRNRYNTGAHFDLHDILTNFGATRFTGGLNLAAQLLGKPGKMDVEGHMVQDLYDQGRLDRIHAYCRCDVLDTYFVFLRTAVMMGSIQLSHEQAMIAETKEWIAAQQDTTPGFAEYLERWGDWPNPWQEEGAGAERSNVERSGGEGVSSEAATEVDPGTDAPIHGTME